MSRHARTCWPVHLCHLFPTSSQMSLCFAWLTTIRLKEYIWSVWHYAYYHDYHDNIFSIICQWYSLRYWVVLCEIAHWHCWDRFSESENQHRGTFHELLVFECDCSPPFPLDCSGNRWFCLIPPTGNQRSAPFLSQIREISVTQSLCSTALLEIQK